MDKHTAVRDWLRGYSGFERLFFNFGTVGDKSTHLIPTASDYIFKKDILGTAVRHYDFAVIAFNNIDDITADGTENLIDFNRMQDFSDWLARQNTLRNFPDLGEKCEVEEIKCLQNAPQTSREGEKAKYMVQCRIIYNEYS